jgi:hypothetical protein
VSERRGGKKRGSETGEWNGHRRGDYMYGLRFFSGSFRGKRLVLCGRARPIGGPLPLAGW